MTTAAAAVALAAGLAYGGPWAAAQQAAGTPLGQWGSSGSGDHQFTRPIDVAADASKNVYVIDLEASRVQRFDGAGGLILDVWGSAGNTTNTCQFLQAWGVAVDSEGNVYVPDFLTHRIKKCTGTGVFQQTFGAPPASNADGRFDRPTDVAVDAAGNIYVADLGNHRVQKLGPDGAFLVGWGSQGSAPGQFSVAVGPDGRVYVVDKDNYRIQVFDAGGTFVTAWGRRGAAPGEFGDSLGHIAVDAHGKVYVADQTNGRIQKFDADGVFLAQWGTEAFGVAADRSGRLFVTGVVSVSVFATGETAIATAPPPIPAVTAWGLAALALALVALAARVRGLLARRPARSPETGRWPPGRARRRRRAGRRDQP